ncbi:SusC/RagA family TonB-linked outer membrane protein [Williamwhitmania taraxaci]|uniref:TonB-linked outer membrane protein, SusC/RagA family n=1 Tax=Williamwhitmania taraxaci TaxID=1640674 RepID=A0A1G6HH72_9BACT|nr:SusC/RagA family TonB-linked outer membrane protein [Williamwhitmania taraxaci]SDB93285.1 TonB-linked outer membrane protein, SusC/RagA family [Williamwhitmania taraxaci]
MKRLSALLALLMLVTLFVQAQQRQVTGTVTGSDDGKALPGVSIQVKGTTSGGTTDMDGKFSITVPDGSGTLVFRFVGYKQQETVVGDRTIVNVILETESLKVEEVVVTALGISRAKKALGYAVQDVQGDDLTKVRSTNVVSSLTGRLAGVQISTASGQMGGGAKINIRGNTSFTGSNQPLFVIDGIPLDNSDFSYGATGGGGYDFGNLAQDINPDDIESVSVLKGASASALYGSRAANGVVMITTKKSKNEEKKTIGVSVNSSLTLDKISIIPQYQKEYGGGSILGGTDGFDQVAIGGKTYNIVDYATDESWGPKYDANIKYLPFNAFDSWDTENYLVEKPWLYPKNDYNYFFKTAVTNTNNVSMTAGDQNSTFRLSYTNMNSTGNYAKSELKRNTLSFNVTHKLHKSVEGWANANYVVNDAVGRPETGYGDRNPVQKMWQWIHTSIDYKDLEAWQNPDGTQRPWNRTAWNDGAVNYTDNPYWSRYKNYETDRRDRFYGNAGVHIKFLPWLKLTGRVGADYYTFNMQERMAVGSQATSEYLLDTRSMSEVNSEFYFTLDKRVMDDKIGLNAIIGANRMDSQKWRSGGVTIGGLVVPELYNLSNSATKATSYDYKSWKRINSVYGNFTMDYDRLVYLELTARNDWSSTLPSGLNSYFYPSVNLSFVLSELSAVKDLGFVTFAKVRAGIAQVGNDTQPYNLENYYAAGASFGDNPRYSLPTTRPNFELKPEKTNSWEIGTEMKFLDNRFGLDVSYYYKETVDQIIPARVSGTTGFGAFNINTGKMVNKGWDLSFSLTPVKVAGFQWDIMINAGILNNEVVEIDPSLEYLALGNAPFKVQVGAFKGYSYPIIYGTDFVMDAQGNKVISPGGNYLASEIKPLANATPNLTGGITNTFTYKGFDVSVLVDMQRGGNMYYTSYMWGMYSGIMEESAKTNEFGVNIREDIAINGGVLLDGVYGTYDPIAKLVSYTDATGAPSATPVVNTTRLDGKDWAQHHYDGPDKQNIFSTNFVKLREVRFGYTVPGRFTGPIKGLRVSAYGRNLATWGRASQHFDPEYMQMAGSNAQGVEGGYIPSVYTIGFGINFNF